jgi:hypothetical protein
LFSPFAHSVFVRRSIKSEGFATAIADLRLG